MSLWVVHSTQREAYLQGLLNCLLRMKANCVVVDLWVVGQLLRTNRSPAALVAKSSATSICSGMGEDLAIAKRVVDHRSGHLRASRGQRLIEHDDVHRKMDVA